MVVGLNRQESVSRQRDLSFFQYVLAGLFTGTATRSLIQPLDVIKIRFQLQEEPIRGKGHGKYSGLLQCMQTIYREEGVASFWRGHVPAQGLSIIYGLVQFSAFELLSKKCAHFELFAQNKLSADFICGAGAGCAATACAMPLDVIRTRMVVSHGYRNLWHPFIKTWRKEGLVGFFRGLVPSLVQIAPNTGFKFVFYNQINTFWASLDPEHAGAGGKGMIGRFGSGALAGIIAKSITYPFDLVRHRLQINARIRGASFGQTTVHGGMLATIWGIVKHESVSGLYKGLRAAVAKESAQSGLSFFFYELACDLIVTDR